MNPNIALLGLGALVGGALLLVTMTDEFRLAGGDDGDRGDGGDGWLTQLFPGSTSLTGSHKAATDVPEGKFDPDSLRMAEDHGWKSYGPAMAGPEGELYVVGRALADMVPHDRRNPILPAGYRMQ